MTGRFTTRQDEANPVVCAPSHEKQFPFWACNKSFIYQMFGQYDWILGWFFSTFLWTLSRSRFIKTQIKKNSAEFEPY